MPDLGKAYVQIVPKAEGISGKIENAIGGGASQAGEKAGASIGGSLVSTLKGVIVAAGIGEAVKATLEAGGAMQQSFGGLDTLYGNASEAAKKYAYEAAQAGISANDYAEQAVSFGAALKQAYEGDATKAVEAANTAIMDMTDNAAKMGTPIENIQNAYQGFAKQNYTMLDNLKLGYGGTKSEMERLLSDAQELSGVEYNIDNLGDVYDAIHVIQEDLGLTGVAAQEASETFTGSMGAMKTALDNVMAGLALGEDISAPLEQLLTSVEGFLVNNLFPMVGNILSQLPMLLTESISASISAVNWVADNAQTIIDQGLELVGQLAVGLIQGIPQIAEATINLALAIGDALMNADWATIGTNIMNALKSALAQGNALLSDTGAIQAFLDGMTQNISKVTAKGVEIINGLVNGILQNLPQMITTAGTLISQFAGYILQNIPTLLQAGADMILNLINGIHENLPEIKTSAADAIADFVHTILDNLPQILECGVSLIIKLAAGIITALPDLLTTGVDICLQLAAKILDYDWLGLGKNILEGVGKGITSSVQTLINALWGSVSQAIEWVKQKLHIGSPSKLMADVIGKNMALGIAEGFEDNIPKAQINAAIESTVQSASNALMGETVTTAPENMGALDYAAIYEAIRLGAEAATLQIDIDGRSLKRELRGLGVQMA